MIYVGCCGIPGGLKKYAEEFKVVEINRTFYKLPKIETVEKWRSLVPKDFTFCVKCFQGVTHTVKSPTWRKSGFKTEEIERLEDKVGYLKPTKEVFEFWNKTLSVCKALKAKVCLIQLPSSFKENEENVKNAIEFFSKIKTNDVRIALELRGWSEEGFSSICEKFDLAEVVDPLVRLPGYVGSVVYLRLHGSYEGNRINYKHKYSLEELKELRNKVTSLKAEDIYVMFNNIFMKDDAKQFLNLLQK